MKKKKVRVRRAWKIQPVTRIEKSRKKYDRRKVKLELKKDPGLD